MADDGESPPAEELVDKLREFLSPRSGSVCRVEIKVTVQDVIGKAPSLTNHRAEWPPKKPALLTS